MLGSIDMYAGEGCRAKGVCGHECKRITQDKKCKKHNERREINVESSAERRSQFGGLVATLQSGRFES